MLESEVFEVMYESNVSEFEEQLLYNSEQEIRKGRLGQWCQIADIYVRQLNMIIV